MCTQHSKSDPLLEAARRAHARRSFDAAAYVRVIRESGHTPHMLGDWFGISYADGVPTLPMYRRLELHEQAREADPNWKTKVCAVLEGEAA